MAKSKPKGQPPSAAAQLQVGDASLTSGKQPPLFCLHHLHHKYCLDQLDMTARAAFAMALAKRASVTWDELAKSGKHGLGWELLPISKLSIVPPPKFADNDQVMVFRYHGKLPMVGFRVATIFHVWAIERHFGELYKHGGS